MPGTRSHRILLITTGGTIAGNVARREDDAGAAASARAGWGSLLMRWIEPTLDHIQAELDLAIEVHVHEFSDIDSSDIGPEMWTGLAQLVHDSFDDHDSFIVTHGTNTLGYTAAALSFAIANSGKPIVLTGSQVPAGLPASDALVNVANALRVATWPLQMEFDERLEGVMAVFGSAIITGTRVQKATEFDYDALQTFHGENLGRIGRIISLNPSAVARHRSYLVTGRYRVARRRRDLVLRAGFDMRIASLTEFPGMDVNFFASLVERNGVRGFILRSFGAGDPAARLRPAFTYLRQNEIPIVVSTQAPNGISSFQANESGRWLSEHRMAIPAYDMSIEAQTTKLGWLLAQQARDEISYDSLCDEMLHDLRGEITPLWEF